MANIEKILPSGHSGSLHLLDKIKLVLVIGEAQPIFLVWILKPAA